MTEEVSLRQRFVSLSGILGPRSAAIVQDGVVGIDLAGNASLDVVVKVTDVAETHVQVFGGLRKPDGSFQDDEDKVTINERLLKFAKSSSAIRCSLRTIYTLRQVLGGGRTIVEGDDNVVYRSGDAKSGPSFEMVSQDDLKTFVWVLQVNPTGGPYPNSGLSAELARKGGGKLAFAALHGRSPLIPVVETGCP